MVVKVSLLSYEAPFVVSNDEDLDHQLAHTHLQFSILIGNVRVNQQAVDYLVKDYLSVDEF